MINLAYRKVRCMKNKIFVLLLIFILGLAGLVFFYLSQDFENEDIEKTKEEFFELLGQENIKQEIPFEPEKLEWSLANADSPWEKRDAHTVEVFNNKMLLMGGIEDGDINIAYEYHTHFADVWASSNGKDWELITNKAEFGKRRAAASVVFNDKIWIFGGWEKNDWRLKNDVWYSKDGLNWIEAVDSAAWTPRKGHAAVVFNNKIYLMGGVDNTGAVNDVWASENGTDWELVAENAPWVARYDLTAAVFEDKIYLTGGVVPGMRGEHDVWVTEDGAGWELLTDDVPWKGRHGHCLIVFQDRLWILAGWSGTGIGYNDVWYSEDGLVWTEIKDTPFKGREDPDCAVYNDKIWIMGGMLSSGRRVNDVWCLGY